MKDDKYITNEITTSEKFEVVNMGISDDPEDQKMILNILTNTLYTNKIAAVLREYGCNAADANVEAGKPDVPIKVHIPTPGEPFFSVRDVGGGMTEEQVLKVFCRLGRSTKRNSNAYTGMLGIGSKAGFAYGNSFLVTSFNKGIRTVYNCFRDSVGLPQMSKMDASPTTEEDGIEIKLSVRAIDILPFQTTAKATYQNFKVPPIGITRAERTLLCKGKNWRLLTGEGAGNLAIMGNVGYTISTEYIQPLLNSGAYGMRVELDFDIGELEIAANREGLQYKDRTQTALRQRVKEVLTDLPIEVTRMIENSASLWQARLAYAALRNQLPRLTGKSVTWKGKELSLDFDLRGNDDVNIVQWAKRPYGKTFTRRYPITAGPNATFLLNDKASFPIRRLREYLITKGKETPTVTYSTYRYGERLQASSAILCSFKTEKAKQDFWKKHDLEGAVLIPVSTLPLPPANPSMPRAFNNKYSKDCFIFTPPKTGASKDSEWWTISPVNLKTGKGVYVSIFNFGVSGVWLSRLQEQLKVFKDAGLFQGSLYGIKEKVVTAGSLGSGWVTLEKHLENGLASIRKGTTFEQDLSDHSVLAHNPTIFNKETDKFLPGPAAEYMTARKIGKSKYAPLFDLLSKDQLKPWMNLSEKLPPPTVDILQLEKKIYASYPMLQQVRYGLRNIPINVVVEYVNLVEQSKQRKV